MLTKTKRNLIIQGVTAVVSLAILVILFIRYPVLPDQVPIQFSLDGSVSRSVDKVLFAVGVVLASVGFNIYLIALGRRKEPIRIILPAIFIIICGAIVYSSILR